MTALPTATPHKLFSPARVSAIASNTLLELIRMKVFYFLLIFALALLGWFFFYRDIFQDEFQSLKDVSLGAMWIFILVVIVAVCAVAYVNRVTLLSKMLGQSETRINRQLKRKPR